MNEMTARVTVQRGDAFRVLLDRIMAKRWGCLMLWINDGVVVKVADIEPELLSEIVQEVDPGSEPLEPRKRSARKRTKVAGPAKDAEDQNKSSVSA